MKTEPQITSPRLRVAIIGCGKIADQHVAAIARIPRSEIVALCDHEILMAQQLGERFHISACFVDAAEMLLEINPDVVHITTPPVSHFSVAKQCLEGGCHVYVEKPFTITHDEAKTLIEIARTTGKRITAGHNYQFTPEMLDMRRLSKVGFLGKHLVHIESQWAYDLNDRVYVGAILGDKNHWVRKLPGQLFHNLISHGIAKLVEFLDDEVAEITAQAYQSDTLKTMGGGDVKDELRVMIRDSKGTSAYFTFSTQVQPAINQLRIFGCRNSLIVDQTSGTFVTVPGSAKSYLTFFVPPFRQAVAHFRNGFRNVLRFLRQQLYHDSGMTELISQFHSAIITGPRAPDPIPMREILLTARIMDEIFAQIYPPPQPASVVTSKQQSECVTR
ncbi:MAG: Gfo/Idh/MocA family oxidoreductase [Verrucomicrobiales bacterium]